MLQDRVTDHRIGLAVHGVQEFLEGQEKFQVMISSLISHYECALLDDLVKHYEEAQPFIQWLQL